MFRTSSLFGRTRTLLLLAAAALLIGGGITGIITTSFARNGANANSAKDYAAQVSSEQNSSQKSEQKPEQKPADAKRPMENEKPKNLKILPKNISPEELRNVMRGYARSLGVRCTFCHVSEGTGDNMKFDFASDRKDEKQTARKMMKMVAAINKNYLTKMGHGMEDIACVTCHMGRTTPIVSVDSLPKREK